MHVYYRYRPVQQQKGGSDCGVFAVAFAAVLASGCHPSAIKFQQSDMRNHLRQCLEDNQLSDFPTTRIGRERRSAIQKIFRVPVYCTCRMPDHFSEEMVKCNHCKQWYHLDLCVSAPTKKQWLCSICTCS